MRHLTSARVLLLLLAFPATVAAAGLLAPGSLTAASDIGEFLAVALGVAAFAVGDAIWSWQELVPAVEPPYPGWPDLLYLLQYPLLAAGLGGAALAWRRLLGDGARQADGLALGTLVVLGGLQAALLWPRLVSGVPAAEAALSVAYPLLNLACLAMPGVWLVVALRGLGGRLASPWLWVAGGGLLVALADTGCSWLAAVDAYAAGMPVDCGWMVGYALIAAGAVAALRSKRD